MPIGQRDVESGYALLSQPRRKGLGRALTAAVSVGIEGQIDGSFAFAQLLKLSRIEMGSQRTGEVAKPACHNRA